MYVHVMFEHHAVEEAGVLSFAADNLDVLINLFGFIAIEPAKIAIPAVSRVTAGSVVGCWLLNVECCQNKSIVFVSHFLYAGF